MSELQTPQDDDLVKRKLAEENRLGKIIDKAMKEFRRLMGEGKQEEARRLMQEVIDPLEQELTDITTGKKIPGPRVFLPDEPPLRQEQRTNQVIPEPKLVPWTDSGGTTHTIPEDVAVEAERIKRQLEQEDQ